VRWAVIFFAGSALFLAGCGATHDAAVTSYRVATAPVHFVHRQFEKPSTTGETTTTTSTTSEAPASSAPPVARPGTATTQRRATEEQVPSVSSSPRPVAKGSPETTPKPSPPAKVASTQMTFPTAKPVPDRPGYVYSLNDPGKYVDVSGYAPGSKAKDPYSGKIFLVP
jgi:hypothetical protein